jgi:hypothetical protein
MPFEWREKGVVVAGGRVEGWGAGREGIEVGAAAGWVRGGLEGRATH